MAKVHLYVREQLTVSEADTARVADAFAALRAAVDATGARFSGSISVESQVVVAAEPEPEAAPRVEPSGESTE